MKIILTFLLIFYFNISLSQEKITYPYFSKQTLKRILNNKNWRILVKTEGFLNADTILDKAFVLESKDSILEKRIDSKPQKNIGRILLVFINNQ